MLLHYCQLPMTPLALGGIYCISAASFEQDTLLIIACPDNLMNPELIADAEYVRYAAVFC